GPPGMSPWYVSRAWPWTWLRETEEYHASEDQHRVAEGVEAVALVDRETVQLTGLLDAHERHHEREQGRARQVEVRQQVVDAVEFDPGQHEELGPVRERRAARERLEHPHRRRADGEHPGRGADPLPRGRRDVVALAVQRMVLDPLDRERAERVEADVQGHSLD